MEGRDIALHPHEGVDALGIYEGTLAGEGFAGYRSMCPACSRS